MAYTGRHRSIEDAGVALSDLPTLNRGYRWDIEEDTTASPLDGGTQNLLCIIRQRPLAERIAAAWRWWRNTGEFLWRDEWLVSYEFLPTPSYTAAHVIAAGPKLRAHGARHPEIAAAFAG